MDIKRLATAVFNIFIGIAFAILLILTYQCVCGEEETVSEVERIEPDSTVQLHTVSNTAKQSHAVVIECIVIEKPNATQSEPKRTYTDEELEMLALVIYQEAGSDVISDETRIMVGNVALNRVSDPRFPDTLEEVLTEVTPSGFGAYGRLHWTGLVWPERARHLSEAHAVERAYECAERLLNGERVFPADVVWQAEFVQGTEVVAQQDGFYFCR